MGSKAQAANAYGFFGSQLANQLYMSPLNLSALGNLPYFSQSELLANASKAFEAQHGGIKHGGKRRAVSKQENFYSPQSSEPETDYMDSEVDAGGPREDNSFTKHSPDSGGGDSVESTSGSLLRGQKRPIPSEQKDNKYYERRRRNNLAAKKSRDARKTREDQLAMRVAHLEKENAIFRAQVAILREEMSVLRVYICQKANGNLSPEEAS